LLFLCRINDARFNSTTVGRELSADYSLVQILVVVAIIQVRTLKIEARKGFVSTVFVYESVSPKKRENSCFLCGWFLIAFDNPTFEREYG